MGREGPEGEDDALGKPLMGPLEPMAGQRAPEELAVAVAVAVVMAHRQVPMLVEREPPVQVVELPVDQQVLMPVDLQPPVQVVELPVDQQVLMPVDLQPPVEQGAQERLAVG
jgi:hypothetical protein